MAPRRTRRGRGSEIVPGDYLTGVSYLPETVSQAPSPAAPPQGSVLLVPRGPGAGAPVGGAPQHGPAGTPPVALAAYRPPATGPVRQVPLSTGPRPPQPASRRTHPANQGGAPPTGLQPGQPTKSRSGRVLGVLVAVVVGLVVAFASRAGDSGTGSGTGSRTDVDDASIARLVDNCTGGYWASCEQLAQWPTASEQDREVGRTCGGRTDGTVDCRTLDQDGTSADASAGEEPTDQQLREVWADLLASGDLTGDHTAEALAAGGIDVDQLLATLQFGCLDHDRDACLHLRQMSTWDPGYLVDSLRMLRAECTTGDDEACTLLGTVAEEGTEDRTFGRSCGGRADAESCV